MKNIPSTLGSGVLFLGLLGSIAGRSAVGEEPAAKRGQNPPSPSPRPGLTAQQEKAAVGLAQKTMKALREKTKGASLPEADRREYVVNVELLASKANSQPAPDAKDSSKAKEEIQKTPASPRAVVTSYRYFDDVTVFSIIDLNTDQVVDVQVAQHLRTPLSDEEYEDAKALAREKSDEIKQLFAKYGDKISVYPQYSQFKVKGDSRIHRMVQLTYRVSGKDLSHPRPAIDLTTRSVEILTPEAPAPGGGSR